MAECKYSCQTATETLEWINAIVDFLRPYTFLINAHVVNFFKDKLWEVINKEWIDCLRREPVENLLLIPSGVVQDHWPFSLKEFVLTLRSLVFCRDQADIHMVLPGLQVTALNSVLAQGMNPKKKHEVEVLSAVVSKIANSVKAHTIVDVGAGQGYLAQVLSFQYQHPVVAIDASSHHGSVTDARAERIKKHYAAHMAKSGSGIWSLNVPKTITCRVLSIDMLKTLSEMLLDGDDIEEPRLIGENLAKFKRVELQCLSSGNKTSLVLAGLHACGDLSVTMLKTFLECKEVKAVVSIGCCYNLLSEENIEDTGSQCGFPMSHAVKSSGLSLGKSSRDLACQSAERWRSLETHDGVHNFELHAFRAAFQMVLSKYYPEVMASNPSIGRQGKALRRRKQRRAREAHHHIQGSNCPSSMQKLSHMRQSCLVEPAESDTDAILGLPFEAKALSAEIPSNERTGCNKSDEKYSLFGKFCQSASSHLGIKPLEDIILQEIWKEAEPFLELIGPYWSLRASLGPLLETLILLDRLLFLQEQGGSLEAFMLPIFDPILSPRNVAIIAKKIDTNLTPEL
ncbi:protein RRNAD1 isoform X1 [Quillaja saponaria]|uniref:Protein RRNAD1 isoform X1 n=1 Tax=Quillaja saponaria TaxID=32244 RepID=A0AAD7QJM5_QUISA|nr:protein RRNAD1 isoform X1 [Quillaja saponaria]